MSKLIVVILSLVLVLLVVGCKKSTKATVMNDKSEVLVVVEDSSAISELVAAWKSKERSLEKLMPLFEYKIEMDIDGETQVWRFNKGGYLMKDGESILYKTPQKEVLAKYTN